MMTKPRRKARRASELHVEREYAIPTPQEEARIVEVLVRLIKGNRTMPSGDGGHGHPESRPVRPK